MKKKNVIFLGLLVVLLAMGLVFVGCDNDDDPSNNNNGGSNHPFAGNYVGTGSYGTATLTMTETSFTLVYGASNWSGNYTYQGNIATLTVTAPAGAKGIIITATLSDKTMTMTSSSIDGFPTFTKN